MTPEKAVQSKIMSYLANELERGQPLFYERRQAGGFSYKAGLPDLYFVYNGTHVEVEVKRPGGQRSSVQDTWKRKFGELNIHYMCVDNVEEFKQIYRQLFKGVD